MAENSQKKPREDKEEKTEKKKKKEKGVSFLYKTENEQITRLRPTCERCGLGYFMGDHGDRYTCGHCGFTRYKIASENKNKHV
ncbi:30S ribosomal protein S27ae [Candidatus Bathyarchaeota archaeon]|nr:30S ribosomal protein S27ae [Candidatus Bathyarchaeota archaeon]